VLGDPARAEQRLNLAQAFNPAGAIAGIFIGREFILSGHEPSPAELAAMSPAALEQFRAAEAHAVQTPYLVLAAVVLTLAAIVALVRFPADANRPAADTEEGSILGDLPKLLAQPRFVLGVVAQFFYVGAQVGVWSYMIRYAQAEIPGMGEKAAAGVLILSLWALLAGRFIGTALMSFIAPARLMAVYGLVNVGLVLIAVTLGGRTGLYALAATSFFMSIMFPTIFALAVKGLGPQTKTGAAFVVMAIIGGAVMTPLMGWISHLTSIQTAMVIPAVCFAVVGAYALTAGKTSSPA